MIWAPLLAATLDVVAAVSVANPPAAPTTIVAAPVSPKTGDKAPDFVYQSHDYMRRSFRDMLAQGSVLLVFAPTEADLRSIDADREDMLARGVVPVAVLERSDREVWKLVRRMNLEFSLLSDPRGAIAEDFGARDTSGQHTTTAWFVVSSDGRIRGCGRGTLPHELASTAYSALGQPTGSTRSASQD